MKVSYIQDYPQVVSLNKRINQTYGITQGFNTQDGRLYLCLVKDFNNTFLTLIEPSRDILCWNRAIAFGSEVQDIPKGIQCFCYLDHSDDQLNRLLSNLFIRSEERREGKSVDLGGRRIIKKK